MTQTKAMAVEFKLPKLAKKQEKVLNLLNKGKSPAQVAKAMKISPNGVYGHMRRIEAKGYEVPRGKADASPKKATKRGRPPKASTNGSGPVAQIDTGIAKLIEQADKRETEIRAKAERITADREQLSRDLSALNAEASELQKRRKALASV